MPHNYTRQRQRRDFSILKRLNKEPNPPTAAKAERDKQSTLEALEPFIITRLTMSRTKRSSGNCALRLACEFRERCNRCGWVFYYNHGQKVSGGVGGEVNHGVFALKFGFLLVQSFASNKSAFDLPSILSMRTMTEKSSTVSQGLFTKFP
ncbi:MAG: hypothetical protein LBU32_19265 [Clostridiales bacterium]|nr:hypothetical protein [Clostridiales bacterium]